MLETDDIRIVLATLEMMDPKMGPQIETLETTESRVENSILESTDNLTMPEVTNTKTVPNAKEAETNLKDV